MGACIGGLGHLVNSEKSWMQKSLLFPDRPSKKKMEKIRAQLIMLQLGKIIS